VAWKSMRSVRCSVMAASLPRKRWARPDVSYVPMGTNCR
jgi:hypothetical protein